MNVLGRLQEIFRDIVDDEDLVLTMATSPDDVAEWDSLAHINIIIACETEFGIKFDLSDITIIKDVRDIVDAVERKLAT